MRITPLVKISRPISSQPIPENARKVFEGVIFDVYQWEQKVYDGSKVVFEKVKRSDSVIVFPVFDDGKILLIKEEQPSIGSFLGAPGGRIEKGEDVLDAAKRELLEETGYEASEFTLWNAYQPITKVDWAVYIFVAKGLKQVANINLDPGEKITPYPVDIDQFIEIASNRNFGSAEIVPKILEVRLFPEKMKDLRILFKPK